MTKRRRYSDEFKLDAIRLVKEQGYNRSEAARNLGIDPGMLGRWILEQERKETRSGPGASSGDLQDEVKRLRELRQIRETSLLKNSMPGSQWLLTVTSRMLLKLILPPSRERQRIQTTVSLHSFKSIC